MTVDDRDPSEESLADLQRELEAALALEAAPAGDGDTGAVPQSDAAEAPVADHPTNDLLSQPEIDALLDASRMPNIERDDPRAPEKHLVVEEALKLLRRYNLHPGDHFMTSWGHPDENGLLGVVIDGFKFQDQDDNLRVVAVCTMDDGETATYQLPDVVRGSQALLRGPEVTVEDDNGQVLEGRLLWMGRGAALVGPDPEHATRVNASRINDADRVAYHRGVNDLFEELADRRGEAPGAEAPAANLPTADVRIPEIDSDDPQGAEKQRILNESFELLNKYRIPDGDEFTALGEHGPDTIRIQSLEFQENRADGQVILLVICHQPNTNHTTRMTVPELVMAAESLKRGPEVVVKDDGGNDVPGQLLWLGADEAVIGRGGQTMRIPLDRISSDKQAEYRRAIASLRAEIFLSDDNSLINRLSQIKAVRAENEGEDRRIEEQTTHDLRRAQRRKEREDERLEAMRLPVVDADLDNPEVARRANIIMAALTLFSDENKISLTTPFRIPPVPSDLVDGGFGILGPEMVATGIVINQSKDPLVLVEDKSIGMRSNVHLSQYLTGLLLTRRNPFEVRVRPSWMKRFGKQPDLVGQIVYIDDTEKTAWIMARGGSIRSVEVSELLPRGKGAISEYKIDRRRVNLALGRFNSVYDVEFPADDEAPDDSARRVLRHLAIEAQEARYLGLPDGDKPTTDLAHVWLRTFTDAETAEKQERPRLRRMVDQLFNSSLRHVIVDAAQLMRDNLPEDDEVGQAAYRDLVATYSLETEPVVAEVIAKLAALFDRLPVSIRDMYPASTPEEKAAAVRLEIQRRKNTQQ